MFNSEVVKVLQAGSQDKKKLQDAGALGGSYEAKPMLNKTLQYVQKFSALHNDAALTEVRKWVHIGDASRHGAATAQPQQGTSPIPYNSTPPSHPRAHPHCPPFSPLWRFAPVWVG